MCQGTEASEDLSDRTLVWTNLAYRNNHNSLVYVCRLCVWNGGGGIPNGKGHICFWEQEIRLHNVDVMYRKNVAWSDWTCLQWTLHS